MIKPFESAKHSRRCETRLLLTLMLVAMLASLAAQPSGGPYGPVPQTYALPKTASHIYYVAPDGKAEQNGSSISQPTTLESAFLRVRSGDVIILRGGLYRTGHLIVNQGITLQPYADEQPVLKGTRVATQWKNLGNGLWTTYWPTLFSSQPQDWWRRDREGKKTALHRFNNDMVFVDGRFLQSAGWEGEVDANSYYIDYASGTVYIGIDPADKLVEITAFDVAIQRTTAALYGVASDRKGYTIRGLTFSQYAYRALEVEGTEPEGISPEANHGKEVIGTTLENCTISYCSRVAAYLRGDGLTIRHCRVSDTSTEGIYIIASNDVLLEKNIFTRNNMEQITGYYPAAVKIFNQCHRVTCRDNLVIDLPYSNGIWYDVGNVDGVFVNNWVQGVGRSDTEVSTDQLWPSDNGFFFEISKGVICGGNLFVDCDHGLMILNASAALIYNNTYVNSMACIGRNARVAAGDHFGWHASTGPDIEERKGHVFVNNLLVGREDFNRPLLFVWQPATLCERLTTPMLDQLDHNAYVRQTEKTKYPLILWSPATRDNCQTGYVSTLELHKTYPSFESGSRTYSDYHGPLFQSAELGHYATLPDFPAQHAAMALPPHIQKTMGLTGKGKPYVGAYPALP